MKLINGSGAGFDNLQFSCEVKLSSPAPIDSPQELGCKVFSKPIAVQELVGWLKECEGRIDPSRMLVEIPPELLLGGAPWGKLERRSLMK